MSDETFIKCTCQCCGLTLEPVDPNQENTSYFISIWQQPGIFEFSFRQRLKRAWDALRGYKVEYHDMVLTKADLRKIGELGNE